ncbi:hypothetical protein Taro_048896 [Colocasia esculenta]|uniref:Uncharacterized protein n=1 Tax=Colocasia esculenta TaxID=4460 RepID=A0A843X9D9_COLES|nr:hypothetical protein [Colocasia esculenta]
MIVPRAKSLLGQSLPLENLRLDIVSPWRYMHINISPLCSPAQHGDLHMSIDIFISMESISIWRVYKHLYFIPRGVQLDMGGDIHRSFTVEDDPGLSCTSTLCRARTLHAFKGSPKGTLRPTRQ